MPPNTYWVTANNSELFQVRHSIAKVTRQSEMADLARRATRWVGTFPYILTPIPNLYDHSFPRYGQITFLTFRRPTNLDLWPKILKIFVSHGVPIRNMYAKFHNDRLRNGWDITLWNFAKTRTNKHTNTQTNKHTNKHTNRHGHYNTSPSPYGGEVNIIGRCTCTSIMT